MEEIEIVIKLDPATDGIKNNHGVISRKEAMNGIVIGTNGKYRIVRKK